MDALTQYQDPLIAQFQLKILCETACTRDQIKLFKHMINTYNINISDNQNKYLRIACENSCLNIVTYILSHEKLELNYGVSEALILLMDNSLCMPNVFLENEKILNFLKTQSAFYTILITSAYDNKIHGLLDYILEQDDFQLEKYVNFIFNMCKDNHNLMNIMFHNEKFKELIKNEDILALFKEYYYDSCISPAKRNKLYNDYPEYIKQIIDKDFKIQVSLGLGMIIVWVGIFGYILSKN